MLGAAMEMSLEATIEKGLNELLSMPIVHTLIIMFLSLYAGRAAPKLTPEMQSLFSSELFRLLVYFLIAYATSRDTQTSLIAVGVVYFGAEWLSYEDKRFNESQKK